MRNNINKLVAVAIGVSIMSGSIVPVFAADATTQNTSTITSVQAQTSVKPVLTLEEAIKTAEGNSETLALDDKKISYQNKINDINEKIDDANEKIKDDKKDLDDDTADITLKQLKQQRDFDADKLIQKTTKAYNDLVTKQMKIDKTAKLLEVKNKELSDAKLKKDLGLSTITDLGDTELQIQSKQNEQKVNINQLKDAQDNFKVLTGKDVTQLTLEQDIKYEKFKIDGSVDEYLDNLIDSYLKLDSEKLKLNKDYFDDKDHQVTEKMVDDAKTVSDNAKAKGEPVLASGATVDDYGTYLKKYNDYETEKSAYTTKLSERISYLTTRLSISENQTTLEINKKQLKDSLKQLYTNILSAENSIDYFKQQIELNNKKLSNAKLKYDLGMMIKTDYTKLIVDTQGSDDLDIQLRTTIDTYNTLKEEIQKPWLIGSGASNGSASGANS